MTTKVKNVEKKRGKVAGYISVAQDRAGQGNTPGTP